MRGPGRDLLGVLARRSDAARVRATLIEYDPRNAAAARAEADRLGLAVAVACADAGLTESYADAVPADLVLFAGCSATSATPTSGVPWPRCRGCAHPVRR
ncbi:hypothetical protein ACFQZ4_10855 [Catellatospora coxensis]